MDVSRNLMIGSWATKMWQSSPPDRLYYLCYLNLYYWKPDSSILCGRWANEEMQGCFMNISHTLRMILRQIKCFTHTGFERLKFGVIILPKHFIFSWISSVSIFETCMLNLKASTYNVSIKIIFLSRCVYIMLIRNWQGCWQ